MISIIVPVYKAEKYLSRCVDCIISQTYKDWELLLIDDGSPDNCPQICDEYTQKDNRIKVFHQSNGGPGKARNKGIEESVGDWITFIDSDDFIEPEYLENFYKNINVNSNLFIQGFKQVDINGNELCEPTTFSGNTYAGWNFLEDAIVKDNVIKYTRTFGKLYKKDVIKYNNLKFSDKIWFHEDHLFLLEYLIHTKGITTIKGDLYNYQLDNTNVSLSHRIVPFNESNSIFNLILDAYNNIVRRFKIKNNKILNDIFYVSVTCNISFMLSAIYLSRDDDSIKLENLRVTRDLFLFNKNNFVINTKKDLFIKNVLSYFPTLIIHMLLRFIYLIKSI